MPHTNTQASTQEQALAGVHHKIKRPTSLISQNKEITYTYDHHGNIKTKTEVLVDQATNKAIHQSDNSLIGYKKSVQFFYNPNNELGQTVTVIDTGLEVTKTTTDYFYDAFGRRIAKRSKTEQLSKLNQRGELVKHPTTLLHLSKTQKTEHQTTLMLWEGNRQIQEYTNHHIFTTVYDQDSFEPVARVVQGRNPIESDKTQETFKVYHYHNNHLGTPQELTDDCGNVVWCNYEWAWGGRYTHFYKEQSLNDCAIIESDLQPIRFQGQFYDVETGLHYNRFRYYDSDVGMFIQRDPIGLLGGNNVFAYAPNPVGWVDPWGLAKNNSHKSGDRGNAQAKIDIESSINGLTIIGSELTMIVNGSRIRADYVALDGSGNIHVFEAKNGSGGLTDNQTSANVFDMKNQSNKGNGSNQNGNKIDLSKGKNGCLEVNTSNKNKLRDLSKHLPQSVKRGDKFSATFHILKYNI